MKWIILALTFIKSPPLVLFRPAETSLTIWLYGNRFIKGAAVLALAGILDKNNQCNRTWRGLNSVHTKQELARSESNEILEINILQKFSPMLFGCKDLLSLLEHQPKLGASLAPTRKGSFRYCGILIKVIYLSVSLKKALIVSWKVIHTFQLLKGKLCLTASLNISFLKCSPSVSFPFLSMKNLRGLSLEV